MIYYIHLFAITAYLFLPASAQDNSSGSPAGPIGDIVCATAVQEVANMPYPGDCSKWIKCDTEYAGTATVYTCDEGLWFSFDVQTCVWPDQSGCVDGMGIRCSSPSLLLYGIQGIWLFSTIDSVAQALSASKDSNSDEHKSNTQPYTEPQFPNLSPIFLRGMIRCYYPFNGTDAINRNRSFATIREGSQGKIETSVSHIKSRFRLYWNFLVPISQINIYTGGIVTAPTNQLESALPVNGISSFTFQLESVTYYD
ncbi:chitin binding peritrophin-A domain-containing protein [Aspergillus niger CBS 101883]|uniref:chitin binding peritrophin-A domain-containing protein n=1 Tax=Aspergillus lacticoffeatus (strain CBS 101883) TaxID=1450533 RepID=UPI000D7FA0F7|nr:uncharacterized protein BO96DRAFT_424401 [Aspergillus niger CBS 101883]PYH55250.1 hypothetical protein BO96DRAFT_424401 [Aspergillus niger CBS 101883]